jgi:hypothetical protein
MTDDPDDKRAKDVLAGELDAQTQADLQRWFGLPSFEQVAEQGGTTGEQDIELMLRQERQQKAIDAVDPAMLEAHRKRTEPADDLLKFKATIDLVIDPSIARLDMTMIDAAVAEPRQRERPEEIEDDLKDCTPQALLRDLHRPETDFEKIFEVVDMAAEQRFDIVAEVAAVMSTSWKLELGGLTGVGPWNEARELLLGFKRGIHAPWQMMFNEQPLPNRRWKPEEDR